MKAPERVILEGRELMGGASSKGQLILLHEVTKPRFFSRGETHQHLAGSGKPHNVCDIGSVPWGPRRKRPNSPTIRILAFRLVCSTIEIFSSVPSTPARRAVDVDYL